MCLDLSDLEFWDFLAVALPGLLLAVAITRWKGWAVVPVALLSLLFWRGALILALRLRRQSSKPKLEGGRPEQSSLCVKADLNRQSSHM
jgi:hypothetical protein